MKILILLVILGSFFIFWLSDFDITYASSAIFSDGFENGLTEWTGNDEKWTTSGTSVSNGVKGGEKRAEVKGNTEPGDDILLKNISTVKSSGIAVEFWYRIKESLEDDDHVYVEWTADDANWSVLNDFTALVKSDSWQFASYDLPAEADNSANFGIRFRAHLGAVTSDIFYLDDIVISTAGSITNESTPTPDPIGSSQPILTPEAMLTSISPPEATPVPTLSLSPIPMPPVPTSKPSPSTSSRPSMQAIISVPPASNISPTLITDSSPKAEKQELTQVISVASSPEISVKSDGGSTDLSNVPGSDLEEEIIISKTSNSLSASIYNFFDHSKSFWLISAMVLAVVFSLAKSKKD